MSEPFISVVVPTYNRCHLLEELLTSFIHQKYPKNKYEILIVDNGSTDSTRRVVNRIQKTADVSIRLFKESKPGPSAARNLGIKKARGLIVAFTDDDCIADPNWLRNATKHLRTSSIAGLQGGTMPLGNLSKRRFYEFEQTYTLLKPSWCRYNTCNIFYQKKVLQEVNGFEENVFLIDCCEDIDLAWRVLEKGHKIQFEKNAIIYHRTFVVSLRHVLQVISKRKPMEALLYQRHPKFRANLLGGFILNKQYVYPLFLMLTIFAVGIDAIFAWNTTSYFGMLTIGSYLWGRVLTDTQYKKYCLRMLGFPKCVMPDTIGALCSLVGLIRYRSLVL